MSGDCYSFMTGISSYISQLTPVCLLHTEKRHKTILPFVSNLAFSTSPLPKTAQQSNRKWIYNKQQMFTGKLYSSENYIVMDNIRAYIKNSYLVLPELEEFSFWIKYDGLPFMPRHTLNFFQWTYGNYNVNFWDSIIDIIFIY